MNKKNKPESFSIRMPYFTFDECLIAYGKYPNNRIAMQIISTAGEPLMKVSVNLPDQDLPANHIFVKNYSENAGILQELVRLDVLEDTGITISSGFVEVNVCKII